ncbi:MAG TPA: zinc-binding dehydrogenase, partial [Kribbellaceae bacterium]
QCLAGRYNLCEGMRFFATPPIDGAFAELVTVHEQFAHPVPDDLSDDAAALLEPLSVAMWACRKGEVTAGSQVLITGAGPVGLMALQAARALGAAEVIVTDVNPYRLALAQDLGATHSVDAGTTIGTEPDVLLECSGHPGATVAAIRALARAGRAVLVGMGTDELALPVSWIQEYELTVTGTFRYAHTWPGAIALAASGRVDLDRLVTGHYGLDQVREALTATRSDPHAVKPVVRP